MVDEVVQQGGDLDFDAQFLEKLAVEALLERFAGFAFAAGKLPQAPQRRASQPAGDQEFSTPKNQAGGHLNGIFFGNGRLHGKISSVGRKESFPGPGQGLPRPMLL
jgi:hypothetical protein